MDDTPYDTRWRAETLSNWRSLASGDPLRGVDSADGVFDPIKACEQARGVKRVSALPK
jgi:hypothetical protein